MACPRIAAVAMLWCASHPDIAKVDRPARFEADLRAACPRPNGRTTASGFGKPDTSKLVPAAVNPTDPPPVAVTITLSELSLSDAERARLKALGVDKFTVSVQLAAKAASNDSALSTQAVPKKDEPETKMIGGKLYDWRDLPGVGWGWVERGIK